VTLDTAILKVRDGSDKVYVFPAVLAALKYARPRSNAKLPVRELLPQIVVGHHQWRDAEDQDERFIRTDVELRHDRAKKLIWACLYVRFGDLSRYGLTSAQVLTEAGLGPAFREVHSLRTENHCFELCRPERYRHEPVEVLRRLADQVRSHLWEIVSAIPGSAYRRYYVYLAPTRTDPLPQIGALWATLFYLGSVVRTGHTASMKSSRGHMVLS
jgi:hypothetical protein